MINAPFACILFLYAFFIPVTLGRPKEGLLKQHDYAFSFIVVDKWGKVIQNPIIKIKNDTTLQFTFDTRSHIYYLKESGLGQIQLLVNHYDYKPQKILINLPCKSYGPLFIELRDKSDTFALQKQKCFPDGKELPFKTEHKLLAVKLSRKGAQNYTLVKASLNKMGLEYNGTDLIKIGKDSLVTLTNFNTGRTDLILIVKKKDNDEFKNDNCKELHSLRSNELFENAGPIYKISKTKISGFTNQIFVTFSAGTDCTAVLGWLKELKVSAKQHNSGIWELSTNTGTGYGLCSITEKLVKSEKVESVEYLFFASKYRMPF